MSFSGKQSNNSTTIEATNIISDEINELPRYSSAQLPSLTGVEIGTIIFNTTTNLLNVCALSGSNKIWSIIESSSLPPQTEWVVSGSNDIINSNAGKVIIGGGLKLNQLTNAGYLKNSSSGDISSSVNVPIGDVLINQNLDMTGYSITKISNLFMTGQFDLQNSSNGRFLLENAVNEVNQKMTGFINIYSDADTTFSGSKVCQISNQNSSSPSLATVFANNNTQRVSFGGYPSVNSQRYSFTGGNVEIFNDLSVSGQTNVQDFGIQGNVTSNIVVPASLKLRWNATTSSINNQHDVINLDYLSGTLGNYALSATLSNYTTNSALSATLSNYTTTSVLSSTLSNYLLKVSTEQSLTGALNISGTVNIGATPVNAKLSSQSGDGTGPSNWISGAFGGSSYDRSILGGIFGKATIGAHNNALNAWGDLHVNSGGGNVAIGTSSTPADKLLVNGSIKIPEGQAFKFNANTYIASSVGANFLQHYGDQHNMFLDQAGTKYTSTRGSGNNTRFVVNASSANNPQIALDISGSNKFILSSDTSNNFNIYENAISGTALQIRSGCVSLGNIPVDTNNTLSVNGNVNATGGAFPNSLFKINGQVVQGSRCCGKVSFDTSASGSIDTAYMTIGSPTLTWVAQGHTRIALGNTRSSGDYPLCNVTCEYRSDLSPEWAFATATYDSANNRFDIRTYNENGGVWGKYSTNYYFVIH